MKNYRMIRTLINLSSCFCMLLGMGMLAGSLHGQTDTDEKIRLMSEALAARDVGDLERAHENLLKLLEMNPDDPGLQRLLENVELNMQQPEPEAAPDSTRPAELRGPGEPAEAAEAAPEPSPDAPAARDITAEERRRLEMAEEEASAFHEAAQRLADDGDYPAAIESLERARSVLPLNPATERRHEEIERDLGEAYLAYARFLLEEGDLERAREALNRYGDLGPETRRTRRMAKKVEKELLNPARLPIDEVSPGFSDEQERIRNLIRMGRAQYLNGDIYGAEQTFGEVEAIDVYNAEAKAMLARIADDKRRRSNLDRQKTRSQMLQEIGEAWQRPQIYVERPEVDTEPEERLPIEEKLDQIVIPSVNFSGVELSRAINTLSAISEEYDREGQGVNIVPMPGQGGDRRDPEVHISVRDLTLRRILDLIVDSVEFQYVIEPDAVIVRPGIRRRPDLQTENFPVSPATVQRLIGGAGPQAQQQAAPATDDPFAEPAEVSPEPEAGGGGDQSGQLRRFLQQAAGVDFTVAGSSLVYDGSDIWVTQTPRNLERIRNVFRRVSDVRQVEIEARFLEVNESTADEMGFNWFVQTPGQTGTYQTSNRNLAGAFSGSQGSSSVQIAIRGQPGGVDRNGNIIEPTEDQTLNFPISAPTIPGTIGLGSGAADLAVINGSVDGYDVRAIVRMLSQRTGSDLLSAPKVTVLSGHQANINVAQEIRYPDSYGDTQSEVGRGGSGEGGAAGVTITPGTPQDFQMRRVGVELTVTPTVEQDNSVTLDLNPRVTEFQGFVEYGGTAIAVTQGSIASIPSGFYQPVFATREVNTRVNIWDGATVVMGGLTREEVRRVKDKTPILGDIPVLGRFFRSEGEGSEKRNLLIFVTANLVSPGGSPMRQQLRTVEPGALFQSPTVVTPSGTVAREKRAE